MAKSDVFNKKHEDTLAHDKRAILEEMNLPPALITFIRSNSKNIKIVIAVLFVGLLAWEGFAKYSSVQREKSSTMLYDAISADDTAVQAEQLKELADKYASSGSAVWAQVELGHLALKDGKYQEAAGFYASALDNLSSKNPLYPLVQFSLAQAYENLADTVKAKQIYKELIEIPGFASEGHLGLGRIAEEAGDFKQALTQYQGYVNLPDVGPGPTKDWVEGRISQLKGVQ
nr:tetratricopeptide repeat protein [Desulfobulbaceae bacterium]